MNSYHGNRNLCECHCGTRIDINPKLVEERQIWKQKCLAIQEQYQKDVKNIKDQIYKQCATLMEKEFKQKETEFGDQLKKKNCEIYNLNVKVKNLDVKIDSLNLENQKLRNKIIQLQDQNKQLNYQLQQQKKYHLQDVRHINQKWEHELKQLAQQKDSALARQKKNYENQLCHLRHQITEFQNKYKIILPEIQKLKANLNTKTGQNEQLKRRIQMIMKENQEKIIQLTKKLSQPKKQDINFQLKALERQLNQKNRQIQKLKNDKRQIIKTEIKYETVYVDRPVQVQKIVQKIVQVEKVVKQYIQPKQPVIVNEIKCDDGIDKDQYQNLLKQINNRTKYIGQLQNQLSERERQCEHYQQTIGQYAKNIQKYKNERMKLVNTIADKNRQIQTLESKIQNIIYQYSTYNNQPEDKIIVNIKKDGTYTSTIQKQQSNSNIMRPQQNKKVTIQDKKKTVPILKKR